MCKAYFITCLVPFQIHDEETSNTTAQEDAAAATLFASLAYETQKLHEALCTAANSVTLQWCREAMILVKRMHAEFLLLFQSLKVPMTISWNGSTSKLLDEYMKMSLNILEFCNLLKSAISGMNRRILRIDIDVKCMIDREFLAEYKGMDRQEIKTVYGIAKWKNYDHNLEVVPLQKKENKDSNGTNIIFAISGAITILSSILFCVICQPIPVEIDKEIHCDHLPQMKLFVDSMQDLAKCFNKKSDIAAKNLSPAFLETEMIEKRILEDTKSQLRRQSLIADGEKFERIKETIRQELASTKSGLEEFESEVAKVFQEVLEGRSKLMQQITAGSRT